MNIEFIEESHTYLVDGIITPSVTQIICKIMPDMYSGITKSTLKRASEYGTGLHRLIEYWNEHSDTPEDYEKRSYEGISLRRYIEIQDENEIRAAKQEQTIAYMLSGKPLYCGTFDILGTVSKVPAIIDIKTTSILHQDYLRYQLTMYRMAIEQMGMGKVEKGYCLWLPKKQRGSLVPIGFMEEGGLLNEIKKVTEHPD